MSEPLGVRQQAAPTTSYGPVVAWLVVTDIDARRRLGEARYGTQLRPHNGRDALLDAYQEALDLALYLRQALYEKYGE